MSTQLNTFDFEAPPAGSFFGTWAPGLLSNLSTPLHATDLQQLLESTKAWSSMPVWDVREGGRLPQVELSRWNNEVVLGLIVGTATNFQPYKRKNQLQLLASNVLHVTDFYTLSEIWKKEMSFHKNRQHVQVRLHCSCFTVNVNINKQPPTDNHRGARRFFNSVPNFFFRIKLPK